VNAASCFHFEALRLDLFWGLNVSAAIKGYWDRHLQPLMSPLIKEAQDVQTGPSQAINHVEMKPTP
jgi:hypothetical protein